MNSRALSLATLLLACLGWAFAEQRPVVCLDPGHPSETSAGDKVWYGVTENQINWQVALQLRQRLLEQGAAVVMTKTKENEHVTNKQRALTCNRARAAVMVRLHADYGSGTGYTLYYPDRTGKKDGVVGPSRSVIAQSREAAVIIYRGMGPVLKPYLKGNGVKGDAKTYVGSKQGALTGSIFAEVPTVLVEMVFLKNKKDAEFIKGKRGQAILTAALAAGILQYLNRER